MIPSDADDLSSTFVPARGRYFGRRVPVQNSHPFATAMDHASADDPARIGSPDALSSPDDGVERTVVIDMKNVIGDAVGNVRIFCLLVLFLCVQLASWTDEHKPVLPQCSARGV
jgi:hypothetical protein